MYRILLVLLVILCCTSCATKQIAGAESQIVEDAHLDASTPKILFITYRFKNEEVEVVNKIVTEGKLKTSREQKVEAAIGDLALVQLDIEKEVLHRKLIRNPRVKIIEYVDPSGAFQKKTVSEENPEFTIRVQLDPMVKYVEISEQKMESRRPLILHTSEIN